MRTITVSGHKYTWKVGRKYLLIETVHPKTHAKHKLLKKLGEAKKLQFVVVKWNYDAWKYLNAQICDTQAQVDSSITLWLDASHLPILFQRTIDISITPDMIRDIIENEFLVT